MSIKHQNPYKRGNYKNVFAGIMQKGIVTSAQVVAAFREQKDKQGKLLTVNKAESSATVLLSPRQQGKCRGDCRGNLSAKGHVYFMEPLAKVTGEDRKFRLRWRPVVLKMRVRIGKIVKEIVDKTYAAAKSIKAKVQAKAKPAKVKAVVAKKDAAPTPPPALAPAAVEPPPAAAPALATAEPAPAKAETVPATNTETKATA